MKLLQAVWPSQSYVPELRQFYAKWTIPILDAYAELFFLNGQATGLILLVLGFLNPNVAISGLVAVIVAYAFAAFIGLKESFLATGYFIYNSLLVGFSIGFIFKLSFSSLFLIGTSAALTFLITLTTAQIFHLYLSLPILSIPFTLVSSLIYLAAARFPNLYVSALYAHQSDDLAFYLPATLTHFFQSLGTIIFMPNTLSGICIAAAIGWRSRILLCLGFYGFVLGVSINTLMTGSWALSLQQTNNFNYVLVAMAIGAIFTLPSRKSFLLASTGVAIATVISSAANVFWSQYGIPIFTLPFILVTLSFAYVLNMVSPLWLPTIRKDTPEETLDYHGVFRDRYAQTYPIQLPFDGQWQVWQGFNGQWTHQGIWQYAYDFIITDSDGKTHSGNGRSVLDYYCFNKPIFSPIQGRVVAIHNAFPDNPIGTVDTINNWGNMIIIWDARGFYVEMSHFSYASICVVEGQWLEVGTYIGLCGNSGYSPEPHIHIQLQTTAYLGAPTLPFCFSHYISDNQFYAHGLPKTNSNLTKAIATVSANQMTSFLLAETFKYRVFKNNKLIDDCEFLIELEFDGTYYFSSGDAKLYFGKDQQLFRFFHMKGKDLYLGMLFQCAASIPLSNHYGLEWSDTLQGNLNLSKKQSLLAFFNNLLRINKMISTARYHFKSDTYIKGEIDTPFKSERLKTHLVLDPFYKIKEFGVGEYYFERYQ